VILPSEIGLNVTPRYVIDRPLPYPDATEDRIGEVSRTAISPQFRRRHEDRDKPVHGNPESEMSGRSDGFRKHQPELVLGMYREMYRLCAQVGIAYYVAAMDNRYSRLLNTLGFPFLPIGPVNENVTPSRRVYMMSIGEMERSLGARDPNVLRFMQA
jgi:N-acyl amino acid synthase of PEP-CTERM/exosortase system